MAKPEHVEFLKQCQGDKIVEWNAWREEHPDIKPDLSDANLYDTNLSGANLNGANLSGTDMAEAQLYRANLSRAQLYRANLSGAKLYQTNLYQANISNADIIEAYMVEANLREANLCRAGLAGAMLVGNDLRLTKLQYADLSLAKLQHANLNGANLFGANLNGANLSGANLSGANLRRSIIVGASMQNAQLDKALIYGIAAWDVNLEGATQLDLVITPEGDSEVTVDNLKLAQFIYLLLNNAEIRDVIDTITSKVVLILGRFTPERKAVLDALRADLRKHNYSPILFDFEKPASRNFTATVKTLAHLARFIIADLTAPSSIPHELQAIIPTLKVPVQPVLQEDRREYAMFPDFADYPWVLPIVRYRDQPHLLELLPENVIKPANELAERYSSRDKDAK